MDSVELAKEMDLLGITRKDLIEMTGKDRRTVWRWMTGKSPVPDYLVGMLAQRRELELTRLKLDIATDK